ncbi:MAG: radical SAM protein [bacterium]|nr:radical SAM protein [bacterium]
MLRSEEQTRYHLTKPSWLTTPEGDPRGYIQPRGLEELWFHTGSICNLSCPFCLEGSKPGDTRIEQISFDEALPFMEAAIDLGVTQFSFTGGEPFVNRHLIDMLDFALDHRPCLVLTNGTGSLPKRLPKIVPFLDKPNSLKLRVSLDFPDAARNDEGRGEGSFELALDTLGELHRAGFPVSIARLAQKDEDKEAVDRAYRPFFERAGLPLDTHIVVFPDFYGPGAHPGGVPHITKNCMTTYHTEESRSRFMCSFSKMIVKKGGAVRVYACTLVDDDDDYDLGPDLAKSMDYRIMLAHHRCYSCFACGASCSEG